MPNKSLIIYTSYSGNTEKVALRFKGVLEKHGWICDMFKIDKNTDFANPPFKYDDYDFVCVGSLVVDSQPTQEILDVLRKNPISAHYRGTAGPGGVEYKKVVPGTKKGIVFVTYGGAHMGPKEAVPALNYLALEFEHLKFTCIGRFACPGKMSNKPTPNYFFKDLYLRPDERDLKRAEIFMEDTLELL
jgi:flavodoxin